MVLDDGELWRDELRRLWDDRSITINGIAERLHVSKQKITTQARKLGLVMPKNEQQRKREPATAVFLA